MQWSCGWALACAAVLFCAGSLRAEQASWRVGLAKANITPKQPLWLGGYASRDRPAEGTMHDLWIKVLAIEDAQGRRGVVLTSDLLGFPKVMHDSICDQLGARLGLDRSQIMLTCSHTHSGPVLRRSLLPCYPLDEKQMTLIEAYSEELAGTIVSAIGKAWSDLAPAELSAGEGTATFAVNRRNNREAEVPAVRERGEALKGPVDHSVPVLAVRAPAGHLRAVVFGYACHNTTLSSYQWCGDYAGFAQIELEKAHPQALAMFFAGCGADQNPLPRRSVALCERYGHLLATGVQEVLGQPMRPVGPRLRTAFERVDLSFEKNPTVAELEAVRQQGGLRGRWAEHMLRSLGEGRPFDRSYPYPVQVWKLGEDQLWIALGGEVVVDYALRFKKEFGSRTWVAAYANDVMGYVPSRRVRDEGGYEDGSLWQFGLPADRWMPDIEERIADAVRRLVRAVK